MPIITYKKKLNINSIDYKLTFAFKCCYDNEKHLYLKDYEQSYFDSGDFNIKIDNAIKKFDEISLDKYLENNNNVLLLAILNYFIDLIPSIYYIKFEDESMEDIYYKDDL